MTYEVRVIKNISCLRDILSEVGFVSLPANNPIREHDVNRHLLSAMAYEAGTLKYRYHVLHELQYFCTVDYKWKLKALLRHNSKPIQSNPKLH